MDTVTGLPLDPTTGRPTYPTSVKLEKFTELTEDTYETWARMAKANLVVTGYWPFFSGKVPRPSSNQNNWDHFNMQLVTSLQTHMDPMLQHHLDDIDKAEIAWEILKNKFRERGTVGQLNLLCTALRTRFTRTSPKAIMEKIHELNGVINRLFKISVPSREEWKAMFFLHALGDDGEFEMMHETLKTLLATGTLTSQRIIEHLEHEAQCLKGRTEEKQAQDAIFLTQEPRTKSKSQQKKCTNCGYTNHIESECYRPGGPLHKTKQKDQKKKRKKEDKAHAAKADKSPSDTDSSSHDTAAVFLQQTS